MFNLLISYPSINKSDYEWIQDIRAANDPKYFNVMEPHITLIFPTTKLSADQMKNHAMERVAGFPKFHITFDKSIVVEDDSKTFFHNFLVPSEVFTEIEELHDLLYTGTLESELRQDIPFIPHIGIGTSDERSLMDSLAEEINAKRVRISGVLDKLTLVEYDGEKVTNLDAIPLS